MSVANTVETTLAFAVIKLPGQSAHLVYCEPTEDAVCKALDVDHVDAYELLDGVNVWFDAEGQSKARAVHDEGNQALCLNIRTPACLIPGPVALLGLNPEGTTVGLTLRQAAVGMSLLNDEAVAVSSPSPSDV